MTTQHAAAERFIVRLGDDGRPYSRHATLAEAREAAQDYAATNWAGRAQIIDTADGWKTTIYAHTFKELD